MDVHETLLTTGMVSGSSFSGIIYDVAGIENAFLFAGLTALVLALSSGFLVIRFRRKY